MEHREVVVIGAGPAGAVAAALLKRQGHDVLVLERQQFPRFSIGESLLAHCLEFIEEAGMMPAVQAAGFQVKNGAAFARGERYTYFDFRDKFTAGPGTTFQVQRAQFDKVLADDAARQGVDVRYQQEVTAADFSGDGPLLDVRGADGSQYQVRSRFVLDASGYGRVLARLLDLERPSSMPPRKAIFTHIEDRIDDPGFDRDKILISVHPEQSGIWYWLIPFSNGRCSFGVVGGQDLFGSPDQDLMTTLRAMADAAPNLKRVLRNAVWDTPANTIGGYSASVTRLHGEGFALLGNAAEFLDPVFSSGVTIALRSSKLAADALHRQLGGDTVDWQADFADPLMVGVETFRAYVQGWYSGEFQDVVFYENAQPEIRRMISSILAGYAWDQTNPFVASPQRRLRMLSELCRAPGAEPVPA
ncbi:3-(3-hydroxy-phenyl)propionate/3-hydroxycinnamic acid hydroxylase [Achromobacter deleyi]|uniref:3-(3-hydroxy-phenyl)propionate/3-hydroxycinnamic acid hydroxylase n=1 Tax=Achromobacter deleyi TaxID=1353891 RepID=A0A6S6ZLR5_9BURK|nr:NAD(P)/FAD-dependent oxidoreductase [Achromobacter deleyi]CAB3685537.1 3-(3-hydroxy-phenyl)propionate/3-hydroxycinnamic acid hydroxylase [Achromobacter deleyi]CAB3867565.1 3-(3-hydroxy-phenyl)propionate/3-hydroxycinnamic acid hydroxylase [Achromobacter deleyi]CAB3911430.1 3-(3-hydroxy-phenyl)propionate/3-hydroxycinnamic acid hydroxylase [Achromobacter deleyi]